MRSMLEPEQRRFHFYHQPQTSYLFTRAHTLFASALNFVPFEGRASHMKFRVNEGLSGYPSTFHPESMRNLVYRLLLITLVSPLAFGTDNPSYDQCILQSLRSSQNGMASDAIRRSCEALYRSRALLLPREKSYHVRVLQNLQGVGDGFAVREILRACRRQNQI
ncbi:VF_A0006 family four-cysteine protein [Paraburkholderia caffeinilytica]|uniref:VF_A0006 family four-cysteine protein n=1 Tax=Paraburkholderia caffeinilytica TaxID=1761016 RepID=UPI003DA09730